VSLFTIYLERQTRNVHDCLHEHVEAIFLFFFFIFSFFNLLALTPFTTFLFIYFSSYHRNTEFPKMTRFNFTSVTASYSSRSLERFSFFSLALSQGSKRIKFPFARNTHNFASPPHQVQAACNLFYFYFTFFFQSRSS
jgi:hypothetical protein